MVQVGRFSYLWMTQDMPFKCSPRVLRKTGRPLCPVSCSSFGILQESTLPCHSRVGEDHRADIGLTIYDLA